MLHRFLDAATRRAVDELAPMPPLDSDPISQQLLSPPLPALPAPASDAVAALPAAFPVTPKVGAVAERLAGTCSVLYWTQTMQTLPYSSMGRRDSGGCSWISPTRWSLAIPKGIAWPANFIVSGCAQGC